MDWMGSLGWIIFMYCILSCLLVLRQLDRCSIASQTLLPLKVTGTINEYTVKHIVIFISSSLFTCLHLSDTSMHAAQHLTDLCSHKDKS